MPVTQEMRERILRNDTVRAWISKRAYELHQLGGYEYGKATQDWVNAESELLALASVLEEIFRSRSEPRQVVKERRVAKTPPKSQSRRKPSASALPTEPTIADRKQDEGSKAKPEQQPKKRGNTVKQTRGQGSVN